MSYVTMDHAAWVEDNIAAAKRMGARKRRKDARRGLEYGPDKLSDFQAKVFDILGMVGGGIYNCPISWDTVDWNWGGGLSLLWDSRGWSTFDFSNLTLLVFLCHEARIRCEIEPSMNRMRLSFNQRLAEGPTSRRHPDLGEALAWFRGYVPADHRVFYRAPEEAPSEPASEAAQAAE